MSSSAPDWQSLAKTQLAIPGTGDLITALTTQLEQSALCALGSQLLHRAHACAAFGVATFPAEYREQHAYNNAYLILWIYGLDALMDTCPDMSYVSDLAVLLDKQHMSSLDADLTWDDLRLAHDPLDNLPGLPFSMLRLVETIQPLRRRIATQSVDEQGLKLFDQYLANEVLRTMVAEARWRLDLTHSRPDYGEYMNSAWVSISGGLCVTTVAAVLPEPKRLMARCYPAMRQMLHATRLRNDLATYIKEEQEGTPNAVTLLEAGGLTRHEAAAELRELGSQMMAGMSAAERGLTMVGQQMESAALQLASAGGYLQAGLSSVRAQATSPDLATTSATCQR